MEGFFSQFGTVTNLRLSRSKRTGASKGYAFIEFGDAETASIAAKTMDKYLMHGKQLVAHVVPPETASRPKLFKGVGQALPATQGRQGAARAVRRAEPGLPQEARAEEAATIGGAVPGLRLSRVYEWRGAARQAGRLPVAAGAGVAESNAKSEEEEGRAAAARRPKKAKKAKKPDRGLFQSPPAPKTRKKAAKTPPAASPKTTPRSSLRSSPREAAAQEGKAGYLRDFA